MQDRDITAQICGITYTQIWTKKKRGLRRFDTEIFQFIARHNELSLLSSAASLAIIIILQILLFCFVKVLKTRLCNSALNRLLHPASLCIST